MRGCNSENQLNQDSFPKPLPYIGFYAAGASVLCAFLMSVDTFQGVRKRKLWFPCRWFSLNAATITILGVAAKSPLDINTSMPGRFDQLSKLSGTVLICTAMGNSMPSLGNLKSGSGLVSNVLALGILVITVIANIGIQMGTGVIYQFWPEHIVVLVFMFLILAILVASVLPMPTTKKLLEDQFDRKYESAQDREAAEGPLDRTLLEKMVERFWLMAHTASPQYVMGRSATCISSGAFCLLGLAAVLEAFLRSQFHGSMFCSGLSDYGWSTKVVFFAQAATIAVGTVAPACRWFNAISFKSVDGISLEFIWEEFAVEEYWIKKIQDWRNEPLPYGHCSRRQRKVVYGIKSAILEFLIKLQQGMVLACKLVRLLSILLLSWIPALKRRIYSSTAAESNLKEFVLHLQGEDDLVDIIISSEQKDVKKWIEKGKKKKPAELIELITRGNSQIRSGFQGAAVVADSRVPSLIVDRNDIRVGGLLDAENPDQVSEPRNCWAMPIVNLASIAMALPNVTRKEMKSLLKQIYQGLRYVRLIEKHLDTQGLVDVRDKADFLWKTLEIHGMWFDVDLRGLCTKIEHQRITCRMIVEKLHEIAENRFKSFWMEERETEDIRRFVEWPGEVHAAYCMYKITGTILQDYRVGEAASSSSTASSYTNLLPRTDGNLFPWIRTTISDIIRACLTNIPRVIYLTCITTGIEKREESVREAAFLLGEAEENILPILNQQEQEVDLDDQERSYIDDWASKIRQNTTAQSSTIRYFTPRREFPPTEDAGDPEIVVVESFMFPIV